MWGDMGRLKFPHPPNINFARPAQVEAKGTSLNAVLKLIFGKENILSVCMQILL